MTSANGLSNLLSNTRWDNCPHQPNSLRTGSRSWLLPAYDESRL